MTQVPSQQAALRPPLERATHAMHALASAPLGPLDRRPDGNHTGVPHRGASVEFTRSQARPGPRFFCAVDATDKWRMVTWTPSTGRVDTAPVAGDVDAARLAFLASGELVALVRQPSGDAFLAGSTKREPLGRWPEGAFSVEASGRRLWLQHEHSDLGAVLEAVDW